MFLLADDDLVIMSADEAERLGYSLKVSSKRLVFRSPYNQPHSQLLLVSDHKCVDRIALH